MSMNLCWVGAFLPVTAILSTDGIARLLRNSSLYGPFEETGPGQYRHTPFSEAYLRPEIRGMFRFA